ncbi:hypothetical protein ABW19_dt0200122 [Dactylella cylindrospora]|nr:hypothetical protein ABW19_dt0200122 [Dactylella cylindrospora]
MAKKPSKKPPGSTPASEADTPTLTPAVPATATRPPSSTAAAPTPEMVAPEARDASTSTGVPAARPMRLKVLYSLDDLMPNCLARAKEVVNVHVAHIDEHTPIGFVDLKTCVLNIVYSSPEIMHHQGCDYSVYAYDFSEPDTPMIGLGLLSWVLSLPALNGQQPDPDAIDPAQASRMVTGRVQKNLLGLFAGDVKETLEVRMRLCRVPMLKQADYLNHMSQFSQLARNMPAGVDPASHWTSHMMAQGAMGPSGYMQPGLQGGMQPFPPNPYSQPMPGQPPYGQMGHYQQVPPSHMGHPPQGYPPQHPLQAPNPPQGSQALPNPYASQAPTPSANQPAPPQQTEVLGLQQEGSTSTPTASADIPTVAPSSPPQQPQSLSAPTIGPTETDKEEPVGDPAQPAAKKRKVAPKKPGTGKPRGRPRLTDVRKVIAETQPSPQDLPQDPAASDTNRATIKQAPTPSSAAPSPNLVSTSNTTSTQASKLSTADSTTGSPPSISQTTPLPPPSSAAPSPVALVPLLSNTDDAPTPQPAAMSTTNEDIEMEILPDANDADNDADTEVAESPRDSDIDSLFIGSSPPATNSSSAEPNPSSPVATSPILSRAPNIGFFPNHPQATHNLQETLSRDDPSDEDTLPPSRSLHLPQQKQAEQTVQDKRSPSEKAESPKNGDEPTSSGSQPAPRKRGRPPKNPPALKTESSAVPPSDLPTSPMGDSEAGDSAERKEKKDQKRKPGRPPPAPVATIPAPILPPGLTFPDVPSKEAEPTANRKRRSSDAAEDAESAPAKRGTSTSLVRARIQRQMVEKLKAGEMPTYCMHCGAIETPTWRKAKVMMTNPETGGDDEREVNLCNPCGLWHHNHGTMRPEQFWDKKSSDDKGAKPKKRPRKKSMLLKQESTISNTGAPTLSRQNTAATAIPSSPPSRGRSESGHRATSPPAPSGVDGATEWDVAVNKNLRRIQSSPCGLGTISHPISLLSPDQKTRRRLFPEAKKSPKGLDGTPIPEAEQEEEARAEGSLSPDEPVGSPEMEKENNPPPVEAASMDIEWERELERELLKANAEVDESTESPEEQGEEDTPASDATEATVRPRTPEQQISPHGVDFKTPLRLTPLLASINVESPSFWKSAMLGIATPGGKVIGAQPTPTPSKLPSTNMTNRINPATGDIMLEFLNEWNKAEETHDPASPSPASGDDVEHNELNDEFFSEMNFDMMDEDLALTSEGNAMPSSPPAMFNLYDEDPVSLADAVSSSLFSDVLPTSPGNAGTYHLDLGDGESGEKEDANSKEHIIDLNFDFDAALVVDFSDLVPGTSKLAAIGAATVAATEGGNGTAVTSERKESSEDDSSSTEDK